MSRPHSLTGAPGHGNQPPMLLWSGVFLLLMGAACFAFDRQVTHALHAVIDRKLHMKIHKTTDWAKGGHWLVISITALALSSVMIAWRGASPLWGRIQTFSLAFLLSLAVGSIILHTMKVVLGRRRPRDELELALYGFMPFRFDLQYDSFPSGHALTIFCVAVVMSAALPAFVVLWFALAIYLAMTRVLLNAHFLSDVCIGAGIGMISAREILILLYPSVIQPWF